MTPISRIFIVAAALMSSWCWAVEPQRVVATGGRLGNAFYTPAAGNTAFRHRTPHKLGGPVAEMQIGILDWAYGYGNETPNAVNAVTIQHAWLERASTGQVVPLTFSGSRQLVLPMNSTTAYWPSDVLPSSVWTGTAPARDEVFWLNLQGSVPAGGQISTGTPATFSGAKFIVYPPASDPGTFDTGGTVPAITGSSARTAGLPMVFLGRFAEPGHLSVIGIGDSILDGTGDLTNPVPVISGYGFFNRAALDANGSNAIAMFNLTRHGQTASNFVKTAQTRQPQFLHFANVIVEEYGTNDLGSAGGGIPATILTNLGKIWTAARDAGVQKVIRTQLMPRTASTDSWKTVAGQTPNTGWEAGGKRDTINAGFQNALDAGKIDVLLNTLGVLSDPTDANRWLTNGTSKFVNTDEAHLAPNGNALLAPVLRAALLSLTVDAPATSYQKWSDGVEWAGTDSSTTGDPNSDGIGNLIAYASYLSPLGTVPASHLPRIAVDRSNPSKPMLRFFYRENPAAVDLRCRVQCSNDMIHWSNLWIDFVSVSSEIENPDPDGDGSAVVRKVSMRLSPTETSCFLRLQASR